MSRLSVITPDQMLASQRELFDAITLGKRAATANRDRALTPEGGLRGPFNAWLRAPALGMLAQRLGEALRFEGALPNRQREIAILCVAAQWRADYEWWAHARIASAAGLPDAVIDALYRRERPVLTEPAEALVHDVARAILDEHQLSATLYRQAASELGEESLVELIMLIGYYTTISMTLNVFHVQVPPGVEPPFGASNGAGGA